MSYDMIVVGGGPAGLSAALQARKRNKTVLVVSGDDRDGALEKAHRIDNYLGMDLSGHDMLVQFQNHAKEAGAELKKGHVLSIMPMGNTFYVSIGSDMEETAAVVIATGVVRGKKYVGEEGFLGRGVSYCATCDGMLYRNKDVVVVGLTADAPEEANFLHEIGCRVTYLSPKAPEGLHEEISTVKAGTVEVLGEQKVTGVKVGGEEMPCDGVFIMRPSLAPTDMLPSVELEDGYIRVDRSMATNIPGVFAAGDCTGAPLQVSKAVGEGLIAAHKAAEYIDKLK